MKPREIARACTCGKGWILSVLHVLKRNLFAGMSNPSERRKEDGTSVQEPHNPEPRIRSLYFLTSCNKIVTLENWLWRWGKGIIVASQTPLVHTTTVESSQGLCIMHINYSTDACMPTACPLHTATGLRGWLHVQRRVKHVHIMHCYFDVAVSVRSQPKDGLMGPRLLLHHRVD